MERRIPELNLLTEGVPLLLFTLLLYFTRASQSTHSQDSINHRLKNTVDLSCVQRVSLSHSLKLGTIPELCFSLRHLQNCIWQNTLLVHIREADYFI